METGLKGKVAVITGSGRGMGVEMAISLAKEGANIVVHYNTSSKGADETIRKVKELGVDAIALKADVSKSEDVKKFFEQIIEYYNCIDVLVNNAGAVLEGPTVEFTDEMWRVQIGTQLDGTFYCTREALKTMIKQGSGKIINISSSSGIGAFSNVAAYSAAKAGIIGFTRSVAKEVAPQGIQVNSVAPGFIDSPLMKGFVESEMGKKFTKSQIPIGRFGKMEEIAAAVVFLASESADYFVGEIISPNGGLVID